MITRWYFQAKKYFLRKMTWEELAFSPSNFV